MINLNLALIAIVVTVLSIGLAINLSLKDGELREKAQSFEAEREKLLQEFKTKLEVMENEAKTQFKATVQLAAAVSGSQKAGESSPYETTQLIDDK